VLADIVTAINSQNIASLVFASSAVTHLLADEGLCVQTPLCLPSAIIVFASESKPFVVFGLFAKGFPKNEHSYHGGHHAHYTFNVVGRQYLVCWVVCCYYGIAKQECSETYDNYSNY
jgi:hypothetical protein